MKKRLVSSLVLGDFEQARRLSDDAERLARMVSPEAHDLALCNRGAVLAMMNRGRECVIDLSLVLMRSRDRLARHLASYCLSLGYDETGDHDAALRHGRLALAEALASGRVQLEIHALNRIGNNLLLSGRECEAEDFFREALHRAGRAPLIRFLEGNLSRCNGRTSWGLEGSTPPIDGCFVVDVSST